MKNPRLVKLPDGINPDGLVSVGAAAQICGIPKKTLYHWLRTPGNGLRAHRIGKKRVFFRVMELLRWLDANAQTVQ